MTNEPFTPTGIPKARPRPCTDCPWRRDVPTGHFPPERFEHLASTARDASLVQFSCHQTPDERPQACAGFLLRGSRHNLGARLAKLTGAYGGVEDPGDPLYDSYREMAIANGVDPQHPSLEGVRDD